MRALLCPASLKGVLTARDAAAALARGARSAGADAVELPIADGGEGTADALHAALGGEWRQAIVSDPLGRPVSARWLLLPDGRAVVEAAAAIGLPLLADDERDPLVASSRGLGELVLAALHEQPRALLVGLGGSATVDGGAGLREVLRELSISTTVLCDVTTTLADAARVFGPQKGATDEGVAILERRLAGNGRASAVRRASGRRRRRRSRRRACCSRSRARARRAVDSRPRRLRRAPARLRARDHGRGSGRCDDGPRKGSGSRRSALRGGGRSLRRLRRPCPRGDRRRARPSASRATRRAAEDDLEELARRLLR